jgi:hypothetical protein
LYVCVGHMRRNEVGRTAIEYRHSLDRHNVASKTGVTISPSVVNRPALALPR